MNIRTLIIILEIAIISCFCLVSTSLGDQATPDTPIMVERTLHASKSLQLLTIDEIREYCRINPCYLPLLKDSSYWQPGLRAGFEYEDLFNDSLPQDNPYRNRYLVGDFNVLDQDGNNRQIREIFPHLNSLSEFRNVPKDLLNRIDTVAYGSPEYEILVSDLRKQMPDSADYYIHFIEKIWQYRMIPIYREFSINGNVLYAGGQSVVMCEACNDTLIMVGKFATSARRFTLSVREEANGRERLEYHEHMPVGNWRKYYAGRNRISRKNWETKRRYEQYDMERDKQLGGGNAQITRFRNKTELPNFMLVEPSPEYPEAMHSNGIHEVALSGLARGMLGTPNSIGCIRVSNFAAKFLRWWVPQNCNFFIVYQENKYYKIIEKGESVYDLLPFKNREEGDRFRKWINEYHPREADVLDIWETGDYRNGYILDAYLYFEKQYKEFLAQSTCVQKTAQIRRNPAYNRVNPLNRMMVHYRTDK